MEHCRICNDTGVRNNGSQAGRPCSCEHVPSALYFGCWEGGVGHYLRSPEGERQPMTLTPWWNRLDGCLAPKPWEDRSYSPRRPPVHYQEQGLAQLHHREGWTAIAFWDRTVDGRTGSNSVFVARGEHDFPTMLAMFQQHFPRVVARFTFPLVQYTPQEPR